MPNFLYLRTEAQPTSSYLETAISYAKLANVAQIRLNVTKRYAEDAVRPPPDCSLIHNSPLMLLLIEVLLPGIASPIQIVHDYPGLNVQRDNREAEVRDLLTSLLKIAPGKVVYGTQPVEPTAHLDVEAAAKVLRSSDYAQLTNENQSDLLRRMRGY
jgi:hypothetical protein